MHDERLLPDAGYGYIVALKSTPAARTESIFLMAGAASPQLVRPDALKWYITTGTPPSRPMRMASSIARSSPLSSERMWVM
jgi:hypothetical protein